MNPTTNQTAEETDRLPAVPHRVLYADIPFYSDPACTQVVPDARILILQSLDPDDPVQELDVVPARRQYTAGQIVQWDLNNKKLWEKCWYRNPETGEIEQAWTFHVEFIGKVVSRATLEAHSELLQTLIKAAKPTTKPTRVN